MNSAMNLVTSETHASPAPVRWSVIGWRESVFTRADGTTCAGSSCDKCGASIRYVVTVKSTDGEVLNVGTDCAVTLEGGPELREIRNAERAAADAEWRASPEYAAQMARRRAEAEAMAARAATAETVHAFELAGLRAIERSANTSQFERDVAHGRAVRLAAGEDEPTLDCLDDAMSLTLSLAAAKSTLPPSSHVGAPGDKKVTRFALFEAMIPCETPYGTNWLMKFRATDGAVLVWFSGASDLRRSELGSWVRITGTVKAHKDYQGEAQTAMTRCKIEMVS
jgi:hypothetical protein